jgi:Ras-related protein Rab-1A
MSRNLSEYDYSTKVLVIGDAGTGKSALILRYVDDNYTNNYYNTIGVDFKIKLCDINDKRIKINIWDTAGQEKFKSIISSYYRNSDVIILVFDLTNELSFIHIDYWYS